ncbi:hypothetical protein LEN26_001258 [Aphanomyces euteiches]|nr:hypothetical protein AeMF1_020236 [Aphanomyces euteiches]KAH9111369.1 hypothetical protein AeMF1_014074 [Aphanomyces euteiches]KAH9122840.1 hypothetical protein AeMF1_006022 [Aphanomyces euteiches]KAH9124775.1 hypothetical protein AeMF1_004505 [Aphanomyces euteiches]KAH9161781.1 hypothetical protein LEN26_001258 [Aphanomyces euteiches]
MATAMAWALVILVGLLLLVLTVIAIVLLFLTALHDSIGPLPPRDGDTSIDVDKSPLLRHLPFLKTRLAWTPLGVFPTPVHTARLPNLNGPHKDGHFFIKREDLSSPLYGGNKVRTLQHQLAACAIHYEKHPEAKFLTIGSSGSNQNVATVVHGQAMGLPIHPTLAKPDAPDFDNTLNVLSILSFNPSVVRVWTRPCDMITAYLRALFFNADKIFVMGGNNMLGVLGQIGGILELAEQIEAGELPDVDRLYVAVGSTCTLAGLVLGVCLARHLGLKAFLSSDFKIVAVPVHPSLGMAERMLGLFSLSISRYIPLFPRFALARVSKYLKEQGLNVDLEPLAVKFLKESVEIVTDKELIGAYGTHSVPSLAAAAFDTIIQVEGKQPEWMASLGEDERNKAMTPWLCGHFVAKSFAKLVDDLEQESEKPAKPLVRLFWQTKSWIQPHGGADEWSRLNQLAEHKRVKEWINKGRAHSLLRRGSVSVPDGNPSTYQFVMTKVKAAN